MDIKKQYMKFFGGVLKHTDLFRSHDLTKSILIYLLPMTILPSACNQKGNEDVNSFAELIVKPDVVLIDVRTVDEFKEGHIEKALNIDVKQSNFMEMAKATLSKEKTIAVYCHSGKRSVNAATKLRLEGYKVVNLMGGINAWQKKGLPVTTDNYETDVFQTKNGKAMKFHALMHASIRIEYDGKEIEIDPVLKFRGRMIDYSQMPKADYLFVTHEHPDHFDQEAIKTLTGGATQLITNKRCSDMLGYGTVMANGDILQIADDFIVEAVPAYNTTEANKKFHPQGRDNGFVFTIDGLRVYVAGDTEDIPEMAKIKNVDIAFLPCNQPFTMTPKQFVNAAKMIKPKVLFPYHYGDTDVSELPELLKEESIEVRIRHYE